MYLNSTSLTYICIPPSGAETKGWIATGIHMKITFTISHINAWRNKRMAKPERSRLKHVADAWMNIGIVSLVWRGFFFKQRWQILVQQDILKRSNDDASCPLEDVLVAPRWMLAFDSMCDDIVPSQEHYRKCQQCRILIRSRISQH